MTMNNRPINDRRLQRAMNEVKAVCARFNVAGACMLVSADEAAYTYWLHAPWSAIRADPESPLGWRLRANSAQDGAREAHRAIEGAVHTICNISDFGAQTQYWMEQIKVLIRQAGVEFDHTPFNGKPLPSIYQENKP